MTALEATDPEGNGPVQYQFEETTGGPGGTDRGWETGRTYTDGGLNPGTEYCYRVRVRDSSPNLNESDWSATVCATTDEVDTTPPAPVDWATEPYATGTTTIVMTAAVATDPEGNGPVQYQFDETSGNPGGTDRDWGISRSHTDGSLNSGTEYCYRFRVRDGSPNQNVSDWSTTVCATTLIPNQAPYPSTGVLGEAAKWDPFAVGGEDGLPREYFWGVNDYRHYMRADTGIDFEGATVYYYFDRVGESENSGWQLSREWLVSVPAQYSPYSYTVKYGDAPTGGNVSDPCPVTLVIY